MISIMLPEPWIEMLDELVEQGLFANRSEAIRDQIRVLLDEYGKILEYMQKKRKTKEP